MFWALSSDFKSMYWHFWQGLLCVSIPSYVCYAGLCGNGCCPSPSYNFWRNQFWVFQFRFSLGWAVWCRQVLQGGHTRRWFAHRASLGATIKLFDQSHFISLPQVIKFGVVFTIVQLSCPVTTQAWSAEHSAPPQPGRGEMFSLFGHQFCTEGAIIPPAALNYVVPLRPNDVTHSFCRVAGFLGWIWVSFSSFQADRSPRFCIHIFWEVHYVPDACRTHYAVLCIVYLLFQNRWKEAKKKKRKNNHVFPGELADAAFPTHAKFPGCYVL